MAVHALALGEVKLPHAAMVIATAKKRKNLNFTIEHLGKTHIK
jgi:hypothetical protein